MRDSLIRSRKEKESEKGRRQIERQISCQEGLDHYPNEVGLKCAVSGQGIGRRRKLPYAGVIAVIRH